MQEGECSLCADERKRRKRVVDGSGNDRLSEEFVLAPLVTALNKPRYLALQERARIFARYARTQVLWVQAEDYPLTGEIATTDECTLQKKRMQWSI